MAQRNSDEGRALIKRRLQEQHDERERKAQKHQQQQQDVQEQLQQLQQKQQPPAKLVPQVVTFLGWLQLLEHNVILQIQSSIHFQ